MTEQGNKTKVCSKCNRNLPISDFNRNSKNADGLQYMCRECSNSYNREHYAIKQHTKPSQNPKYASKTPRELQNEMRELKEELLARGFECDPIKFFYKQEIYI